MNGYYLSDAAYAALKDFANGLVPEIPFDTLAYLVECGFVDNEVIDYDTSGYPIKEICSDFHITEFGRGFLAAYERHLTEMQFLNSVAASTEKNAKASEEYADQAARTADSAEKISKIAEWKARKADVKSWIAICVSILMAFFEFAINHETITGFVRGLIT